MMNIVFRSLAFRLLLIGCFFQLAFHELSIARDTQPVVSHINHSIGDNSITVHYDLSGVVSSQYQVSLVMLSKTDKSFRYIPKDVRGDIGEGVTAGSSKSITWNTQTEFPEGLASTNYFFSVQSQQQEESSSISPWVWVGGAVVLGGVAVLLLSKKTQEETPNVFPAPPGRP